MVETSAGQAERRLADLISQLSSLVYSEDASDFSSQSVDRVVRKVRKRIQTVVLLYGFDHWPEPLFLKKTLTNSVTGYIKKCIKTTKSSKFEICYHFLLKLFGQHLTESSSVINKSSRVLSIISQ